MSRRYPPSHHPRIYLQNVPDNPYQPTTYHTYQEKPPANRPKCSITTDLVSNGCPPDCALLTDEGTFTDTNTYYEYEVDPRRRPDSDDSGSRRHSRQNARGSVRIAPPVHRVYPEADRIYHEVTASPRPQSSLSSGATSTAVYGCGGRCRTFENVCYYFMQVAFTMGILIGTSLCIAGAVLRKSAARNLQVLVYIGAMLSLVSALLLGVQCNARSSARRRQKAAKAAKMRAPIPMENLRAGLGHQPLVGITENVQIVSQNFATTAFQQRPILLNALEQQGVPWWRRNDLDR